MTTLQQLRENEHDKRKKIIIDIAKTLCREKGLSEITIRDIAKRAGISTGTIYNYFSCRDEIFLETLMSHFQVMKKLFEKNVKKGSASLEELAFMSVDYFLKNESVFQLLVMMIAGQFQPKNFDRYKELKKQFADILENACDQINHDLKNRLMSQAFCVSVIGVVTAFSHNPYHSEQENRAHIYRLIRSISSIFTMAQASQELKDIPEWEQISPVLLLVR